MGKWICPDHGEQKTATVVMCETTSHTFYDYEIDDTSKEDLEYISDSELFPKDADDHENYAYEVDIVLCSDCGKELKWIYDKKDYDYFLKTKNITDEDINYLKDNKWPLYKDKLPFPVPENLSILTRKGLVSGFPTYYRLTDMGKFIRNFIRDKEGEKSDGT